MNIGLLTYYGDFNCGTNMQALATLEAIRSVYPNDNVEIIPFHGFKSRKLPYKTYSIINLYYDYKRFKKYSYFKHHYLNVKNDKTITNVEHALNYISARNYDIIYIGADTLLELDRLPKNYDGISAYWLKGIKAKKFLIAASSKNVSYEQLSNKQKQDLKIAANEFKAIGIRDRATLKLFNALVNDKDIHYIPDPTFTYEIDYTYIDKYLKKRNITIPKKSVFVQFYSDDTWLENVALDLKKRGFTLITNRGVSWSDITLIDLSPLEQIGIYRYVTFAITHRFHDGVFCLKNHTPFLIYIKSGKEMMTEGESKHISLLKDFNIYPQAFLGYLDSKEGLKDVWESYEKLNKIFNYDTINKQLRKNQLIYNEYLNMTKDM